MTCPGLHCAGCGRGGTAATLSLTGIAALAAWWAFQDLVAVVVVVAVSFVLALAAVSLLIRATQKREARVGRLLAEQRQQPATALPPRAARTPYQAVTGDLHLHFHGLPDTAAAAAIIRQAITGPAGPAAEPVTVPASDGVPSQRPALPA